MFEGILDEIGFFRYHPTRQFYEPILSYIRLAGQPAVNGFQHRRGIRLDHWRVQRTKLDKEIQDIFYNLTSLVS
jgi:hypothetical protein